MFWDWFRKSDDRYAITAALKILFGKSLAGEYYGNDWSPDLNFVDPSWYPRFKRLAINETCEGATRRFLAIGPGGAERKAQRSILPATWEYYALDIEEKAPICQVQLPNLLVSDVCDGIDLEDESVDFVFSNSVFEHLRDPFSAARNIARVLKPGGFVFTKTVFSWRYHPCSEDYWRFTHRGLEELFSSVGLVTRESGYHIGARRGSILGGKIRDNLDGVKRDGYGGWRENWEVIHLGQKSEAR